MAYAYWKSGKVRDVAVFDLFFRKSPFYGEFTIFAGLEQCLHFLENFSYSKSDIEYLKSIMAPSVEEEFFAFLANLTVKDVTLYAIDEGSVVFPRVPLMIVEGPLIVVQLLETTLLNLVNFSSLIATNAARYRLAAGCKMQLHEFGLRRAQGPDGGLTASKYAYIGGFDGTSNVLAGKLFGIPVKGTHAHAYVTTYSSLDDLKLETLTHKDTQKVYNLKEMVIGWRRRVAQTLRILESEASDGELAALISFAISFPSGFVALVDTYDVLKSGLPNFCAVALGLNDLGYRAIGIRIDSGDLAYLSCVARSMFQKVGRDYGLDWFEELLIVASNDINEDTIISLNEQGHKIDCFGIGTHLVTCQRQPALGCVFKLVEINSIPKMKLSQDVEKVTCPGKKVVYRLYGSDGHALIDLMQRPHEPPPELNRRVLCRHPFQESKRAYVSPAKVENLHKITRAEIEKLSFSSSDSHVALGTVLGHGYLVSNTNNLVTGPVKLFSAKTKVMDIRYSTITRSLVGACAENGSFAFLDTNTTKVLKEFPQVHSAPVSALAFSPINELLVVTAGCDKRFITYNSQSKSVVMANQASTPLTTVCFLSSGQRIALGTMTGEILIYDLRVFNSPLTTLKAEEGPISDLRVQPLAKGKNPAKQNCANNNIPQKADFSQREKLKPLRNADDTASTAKTGAPCSPSVQLLSPLKTPTNREEKGTLKNTTSFKASDRSPKSPLIGPLRENDLKIFSPLDKENEMPNEDSESRRKPMSDLIVQGLLSPEDSLSVSKRSSLRSSSGKWGARDVNDNKDHSRDGGRNPSEATDGLLSPLRHTTSLTPKSSQPLQSPQNVGCKEIIYAMAKEERTISPCMTFSSQQHSPTKEKSTSSSVLIKRNILLDKEKNIESDALMASVSSVEHLPEVSRKISPNPLSSDVHRKLDFQSQAKCQESRKILEISDNKDVALVTSDVASRSFLGLSKGSEGGSLPFQLAFPETQRKEPLPLNHPQESPHVSNPVSSDPSHMNLELIRNCVSEVLERHQFHVNQRFMHLHYTMVKHVFNLKKEMSKLIQESSLNDQLIVENAKLKEEIGRLKSTY